MTSFNRKTRSGKGKRGASRSPSPSVRQTPRRSKEAEAPAIAIANLVAEPEAGRSETVETEEASVQPTLPTGERGGGCTSHIFHRRVGGIAPSSPFSCDPRRQANGGSEGRIIF